MMNDSTNLYGKIITFYSFKGGVGRSMALANVAALLSKYGKKILIVDFDLEAPGIENYFKENVLNYNKNGVSISLNKINSDFKFSRSRAECNGLLEIIEDIAEEENKINWKNCLMSVNSSKHNIKLDILPAGKEASEYASKLKSDKEASDYASKLQRINWDFLFNERDLANKLETIRNEWKNEYDFIFVDSRTGISDIGGICTIYLPDIVAFLFTTNQASLLGCTDVIRRAKAARKKLPYDRTSLITIPIPSRDVSIYERDSSYSWRPVFDVELAEFFNDWLPIGTPIRTVIETFIIPFFPYWSFGDRLPVIEEGTSNAIGKSYENIALLLLGNFDLSKVKTGLTTQDIDNIIEKKEIKPSSKLPNMEIENYLKERVEDQIQYYSVVSRRNRLLYFTTITFQIFLGAYLPISTRVSVPINAELQISLIGAFIIILTGLQAVGNFKEKWISYRKTAEKIKQEKFRFLTMSDKYKEEEFAYFVTKMEEIFANENAEWINISKKESKA